MQVKCFYAEKRYWLYYFCLVFYPFNFYWGGGGHADTTFRKLRFVYEPKLGKRVPLNFSSLGSSSGFFVVVIGYWLALTWSTNSVFYT
jgi:hypothetical protein